MALGRGLSELLGEVETAYENSTTTSTDGVTELNVNHITALEDIVHGRLQPDLTFLLDASVEVGRARAAKRSAADRIEAESLRFFNRVREMFLQRARKYERFCVIDAQQPLPEVQGDVIKQLEHHFKKISNS